MAAVFATTGTTMLKPRCTHNETAGSAGGPSARLDQAIPAGGRTVRKTDRAPLSGPASAAVFFLQKNSENSGAAGAWRGEPGEGEARP
jgi:hypothetical protein